MRIDRDLLMIMENTEWFKVEKGVGYVPTEKAPEEIKKAIERFNKNWKECRANY